MINSICQTKLVTELKLEKEKLIRLTIKKQGL